MHDRKIKVGVRQEPQTGTRNPPELYMKRRMVSSHLSLEHLISSSSDMLDFRSSSLKPSRWYPIDLRYPSIRNRFAVSQWFHFFMVASHGKSDESSSSGETYPSNVPDMISDE